MAAIYSAGNSPTHIKIASTTTNSGFVNFSNIPQGYTDLVLVVGNSRASAGSVTLFLQFNGDTTTSYSRTTIGASSTGGLFSNRMVNATSIYAGAIYATNNGTNIINVQNYSSSNMFKTIISKIGVYGADYEPVSYMAGLWRKTDPITSIRLTVDGASYSTGTVISLYGIKASIRSPKATGGRIYTDGSYWYHVFRDTGKFTPSSALTVSSLVIGGGGGGGGSGGAYFGGGGGGAGGYAYTASSNLLANTDYPIVIGAGGTGYADAYPTFGTKSTFNSINGYGGGRGYPGQNSVPNDSLMGSGGGGSAGQTGGGTSGLYMASGQGFKGGDAGGNAAAGGGGAGAAGGSSNSFQGGNGGAGLNTWSSWAYATQTGVSGYYMGGGGGGNSPYYGTPTTNPSLGGAGGGGNGGTSGIIDNAKHGVPNTGSGGGGGSALNTLSGIQLGGNGGSGLVIVRYSI